MRNARPPRRRSTRSRTKLPIRSRSTRTRPTRAYDREYANRFWRVLVQADRVFKAVSAPASSASAARCTSSGALPTSRSRASPGGRAPEHPGGVPNLPDRVTREAYSHEVSSCGFWPGGGAVRLPGVLFVRLSGAGRVRAGAPSSPPPPSTARDLREFILPYDAVRQSRVARRHAARVPADDLRGRGGIGGGTAPRWSGARPAESAVTDLTSRTGRTPP